MPLVRLQCVIVVFPDHTVLFFFADFDTISILEITCSNTHRVGLSCGFAGINCQREIL